MRIAHVSAVFVTVTLLVAGCGFKTDPVPPASIVPQPIDDLRYSLDEGGVTLNWTYPEQTIKGDELTEVWTFDLFRAVVPIDDICETCPIPFGEAIELPGGETADVGKRRVGEYQTTLLRPGHKYFFKMRSRTSWWAASADSNIVSFVWDIPPKAPANLQAVADDSRITLSWQPVTALVDGRPLENEVSYQVFRSEGGKEFAPYGDPLAATRYIDSAVINGKTYYYKVQSSTTQRGQRISGGVSEIVDATPVDKTPPPIPAGVRATMTQSGIRVFWDRPDDPGVAAHRVYRRTATGEPALVAEVAMPATIFLDAEYPADARLYYSVTAIDSADPPNESYPSREAAVR